MCTRSVRICCRVAAAAGGTGGNSSPRCRAASAAMPVSPPEAPIARMRRPASGPPQWKIFSVSHSVASDSQRATPAWAQKASKAASAPASEPVCERAASVEAAVRPVLIKAIGLPAARARATAREARRIAYALEIHPDGGHALIGDEVFDQL